MGAVPPEDEMPRTRKKDGANMGNQSIHNFPPLGRTVGRRPKLVRHRVVRRLSHSSGLPRIWTQD
jgi:hypothetical protein